MDKTKREDKFIYALIIFLILAIIFSVFFIVGKRNTLSSLLDIKESLRKDIERLQEEKEYIKIDYETLLERKEYLEGLKEKEEQDKALLFSNIVKLEDMILSGESDAKIAYLTIDDGPNKESTRKWLDVLNEKNVLATFFVVKKDGIEGVYKEIIDNGHTLGNHTSGHDIFGENGVYMPHQITL